MLKRLAATLLLVWPAIAMADPTDSVDDAVDVINLQVTSLNAMADQIEAALADPRSTC